ncbi:uncharacterized protein LOC134082866 isoform X2 [Sardina pilchardus]|uniref:uncharacterized protein LOC134082866 isoform X2 n=1 Tax=Sardina pilchardus TaxID=27697 RepID=UPI002E0F0EB7
MDCTSKGKDAEGNSNVVKEKEMKKRSRQKRKGSSMSKREEREEEEEVKTNVKTKKLQKPISGTPLTKGGTEDIWNWSVYKTQLPVTCGDKDGTLHKDKLAKGEKCFFHQGQWYTPPEFEKLGGKERNKNWKISIRCGQTTLQKLIQGNHLMPPPRSASRATRDKGQREEEKVEADETDAGGAMEGCSYHDNKDLVTSMFEGYAFPVQCGPITGRLQKDRFVSRSKGKCIRTKEDWLTPEEFVMLNPDLKEGMWKRDIICRGLPLGYLLQCKILQAHSLLCKCSKCGPTKSGLEDQRNDDYCFICGERGKLLLCDGCPRSFHREGSCHLPNPPPTPGDVWLCTFCVCKRSQEWCNLDHMTQQQILNSIFLDYKLQCQYLLLFLLNADEQRIFTTDPCLTVPGYLSVIPKPMWLQQVRKNLENRYYLVGEFVSDVRLIFRNCAAFNKKNILIKQLGMRLSDLFEKEFCITFNISTENTSKDRREEGMIKVKEEREEPDVKDNISPLSTPLLKRVTHQSSSPQRSCESCVKVPDSRHWVRVEPDVSTEESVSTYRLSSPAGSYECSESGIRWLCAGPVTLQYHFIDWQVLANELPYMQYRPAGPSMDIKLISGELEEIHMPHFLCLGGSQSSLVDAVKVLHKQDSGVHIEKCELSRFHVKLVNPSFSLIGPFISLMSRIFPAKEEEREKHMNIHADVQIYQSSTVPLTFRTYLLPEDAQLRKLLEDQEERFRGHMLPKPRPVRPLQMNEFYALQTDCNSTISPEELDLRYSSIAPNFSEVTIREASDFSLKLFSHADRQRVWKASVKRTECFLGNPDQSGVNRSAVEFFKKHRPELVQRVKNVMPIADQMLSQGHFREEDYANIRVAHTEQDKMRRMLDCCGALAQRALLNILQRECPDLVEELRL